MTVLLAALALLLACVNGANDNSKGAATLIGSGVMSVRHAIALATASTALGGFASLLLAQGLIAAFSGKGLVPEALTVSLPFLIAVAGAATMTVAIATVASLPISTTHALFGGLIGAGLAHDPQAVDFATAATVIGIPLLVSPLLATALALGVAPMLRLVVRDEPTMPATRRGVDQLHVVSAAVVGFARGLNDTPKIAALLVAAGIGSVATASTAIILAMAAGGLFGAHRVARTLAWRVTAMDPREGFAGNLVTSTLVILASRFSLPVSTTHVSTGALFGIAVSNGQGKPRMILTILLAWGITLPLSAALAALLHTILPTH
jgi:PiT family inorganic phosphate transporter